MQIQRPEDSEVTHPQQQSYVCNVTFIHGSRTESWLKKRYYWKNIEFGLSVFSLQISPSPKVCFFKPFPLTDYLGWLLLKKLDFSILEKGKKSRDDVFQECRILRR